MSFIDKLFGGKKTPPPDHQENDIPFMEHPTGEFKSALAAIASAMSRLERIGNIDKWITFSGQGQGHRPDSYQIENVPYRRHTFDLRGQSVDLDAVTKFAGLNKANVVVERDSEGRITLPNASAEDLARFLDSLFRIHFGIKFFEGEDDYATGAEW
jgi:hypothetical protein